MVLTALSHQAAVLSMVRLTTTVILMMLANYGTSVNLSHQAARPGCHLLAAHGTGCRSHSGMAHHAIDRLLIHRPRNKMLYPTTHNTLCRQYIKQVAHQLIAYHALLLQSDLRYLSLFAQALSDWAVAPKPRAPVSRHCALTRSPRSSRSLHPPMPSTVRANCSGTATLSLLTRVTVPSGAQ